MSSPDRAMSDDIIVSSRLTFFTKAIFPACWIAGFGGGVAFIWASTGLPPETRWLFLAAWIAGALSFWWWCMPLKRVRVSGGQLYVSNFRKEIVVPLTSIESVTENRWINVHPVTVHFRGDTEFGRKISFMPKTRVMFFWSSHPVVGELRRMVAAATGNSI
jgi:hypothetical protein